MVKYEEKKKLTDNLDTHFDIAPNNEDTYIFVNKHNSIMFMLGAYQIQKYNEK